MSSSSASRLAEEGVEVGGLLLTAGPVLHALVEDRAAWVVGADGLIGLRALVGCGAAAILAAGPNGYLTGRMVDMVIISIF